MEQTPQHSQDTPTEEQLERRRRREQILNDIKDGKITSMHQVDRKGTSAETAQEARRLLVGLGLAHKGVNITPFGL